MKIESRAALLTNRVAQVSFDDKPWRENLANNNK